jgi:WD40 repeat protein
LNWSKFDESNKLVLPAAISSIEKSHENAITSIKWMARNYQCTSKGLLKEDREHGTMYRQFVTASLDGNICFWDLDWTPDTAEAAKLMKLSHKVILPDELKTESSPFKVVDQLFYPHYKLVLSRPITGITFNEGDFRYDPKTKPDKDITKRIQHQITPIRKDSFNPKMVVGTSIGELLLCYWESSDFSQGAIITPQTMAQEPFANVHDGPITHVHRNPFLHSVFISLGGSVFALWHDDFKEFPIFWRRRESRLTGFQWSLDRPSVFFLICENGSLEIWDLTTRIDIPSMIESLGGNILTEILQHKLSLTKRLLAIGDFNTNLRIFVIPSGFSHPLPNEKESFGKFIDTEVKRKRDQEQWKNDWYESNKDIVDAKKIAEQEVNDEMEQKEKMRKEIEEKRAQMAEAEAKKWVLNFIN